MSLRAIVRRRFQWRRTAQVGVDLAHHLHLGGSGDPEEAIRAAQSRVDLGDAAIEAVPPVAWCQLADPVHRVALCALGEQGLHGPGPRGLIYFPRKK